MLRVQSVQMIVFKRIMNSFFNVLFFKFFSYFLSKSKYLLDRTSHGEKQFKAEHRQSHENIFHFLNRSISHWLKLASGLTEPASSLPSLIKLQGKKIIWRINKIETVLNFSFYLEVPPSLKKKKKKQQTSPPLIKFCPLHFVP